MPETVTMPRDEFMEEHKRLVRVLESPSREDDAEEAEHQRKEMGEIAKGEASEAQIKAGNYRKHHWRIHGLEVTIENLAGSTRSGTDPSGKPWSVTLPHHYGYIRGTVGADGDHLDCMVGPLHDKGTEVTIINQRNTETGGFDEHKVMLGYASREQALAAFAHGRSDDPNEVMGPAITVPVETFKEWLAAGRFKKPVVLKAHGPDTGEEIAKAEKQAHVKGHYRHINGKVVYVPDYDKTIHGDHPEATLHQRTALGIKDGKGYLRATDAEDRKAIKTAADALGVQVSHVKRAGANHHGRVSAYDHIHFHTAEDTQKVHAALGGMPEPAPKHGPDAGPGGADDGADSPAEQAKVKLGVVTHSAVEAIETSPQIKGMRQAKDEAITQLQSFLAQHKGEQEWAEAQEQAIRHTYKARVTQMVNFARTSAMALIAGDDWLDHALCGAETEADIEALVKMGDATVSIDFAWNAYHDKGVEGVDPGAIGHAAAAYKAASEVGTKVSEIVNNGLERVAEPTKVAASKLYFHLNENRNTMVGALLDHYNQIRQNFESAKIASTQKHGFVRPFAYDLGIAQAQARAQFHYAAGEQQSADAMQAIAGYLKEEKALAQKFEAYHDADAEALVAQGGANNLKLAALSFQAKAKAKTEKGEKEAADALWVKAKAAAGLALGME